LSFRTRYRLWNDVFSTAFLLFRVEGTILRKVLLDHFLVERFFRVLFYTFFGPERHNCTKKHPPGVSFSAFFSDSLNKKRRRVFPLSDSLKFDNIGFRRDDALQAYAIPVKLVKNNRGTRQKWWGKWNCNNCRVDSMSLLNMALLCFVSGWDHLISFCTGLRGFG